MSGSIEAVYIVDINGHILLEYPVVPTPPDLQQLLPHVLDTEPSNVIEISPSRLLFHQKHGTIIFLVPCTSNMPSLVPFEFINRLVEVLEVYFSPPLIPMKIESHLDTTTLILNEMVENGSPCMTDPDPMKELVPIGGLFTKLLGGASNKPIMNSPVPWRRSNVRHTNNELFVDLMETMYVIVGKSSTKTRSALPSTSAFYSSGSVSSNSKPIVSRAEGAVFVTSHLSGVPEIQLNLSSAKSNSSFETPSFHQCVDLQRYQNSPGTLNFIPPDGKSLIASYTIENSDQGLVFADLRTGLGVNKDEFEARVWTLVSREVKSIEQLSINVVCGKSVKHIKGMRVTAGDFHINETGIGEWRFPGKTQLGWNATLRGALQSDDEQIHFPNYLTMNYTLTGQVPSGTKIDSLRIVSTRGLGEGVKPYKGVRYTTRVGEWIVR